MKASLIEPGDNPDLTAERKRATVHVGKTAEFIHGPQFLKRRHEILQCVESRPEFKDPFPVEFMTREQRYDHQAKKAVAMTDLATDVIDGSDFFGEGMYYQSLIMGRDLHAMSLHYIMFVPTLQGQTDEEQMDKWLGLALTRGILGTYAQTELGHGTNLNKLETTAMYDPSTQEFVLHSPTVSAAKWWPGSLGKSSTHAIVMAQLYTKGECKGPHPFIVQIRIRVGDIGPKFGINGSDNGFLLFDNYRIPRTNMLMRYSKVLPNGDYLKPKHSKLGFGSMVFVRSIMIRDQAMQLGAAATIATRYSAVRRQGEKEPGAGECQILDYQTQQYRIFPQIARTLVFLFAASEVRDLYLKVTEQLTTGNVELLPELHALSSGLKSVVSWETAQGIEQCRLACGGHGYSHASGLPEIYAYAVGGCTYEGENIVMLLQVARQLVKVYDRVQRGTTTDLPDITAYLSRKQGSRRSAFKDAQQATAGELCSYFEFAARTQLDYACALLRTREQSEGAVIAWDRTSVELCKASRARAYEFLQAIDRNYFQHISKCNDGTLLPILTDLGKLYALDQISASASSFMTDGFFSNDDIRRVREGIYEIIARLRPNAVAVVDAFDFSDRELHSVLGRRDGNVYSAMLEWAQNSPLNKADVLQTFHDCLGPMMRDARSKL